MSLPLSFDIHKLLSLWSRRTPLAVALLGSYARGDADPYSDVDILCLLPAGMEKPDRATFLLNDRIAVVNAVSPEESENWFTEPVQAVNGIASLRDGVALLDPDGRFAAVQARAAAFVWSAEMQAKADRYASREMVGWSEEANKGVGGLYSGNVGRLLNARFGMSWGLAGVMRVQRGVLGNSDNSILDDLGRAMGRESRWYQLLCRAYGLAGVDEPAPTLREEVSAGLALYCETARLLDSILLPEDRPLIEKTVERIEAALNSTKA